MAEEAEDDLLEEERDEDTTPEGEETQTAPSGVEDIARELGWDPNGKAPADVFLREKVQKGDRLFNEVKELKDTTSRLARTSATIVERQIRQAREELEAKFTEAVESGDTKAAWEAGEQLRATVPPVEEPREHPATTDFKTRNAWYESDPAARALAHQVAQDLARRGVPIEEQLQEAERTVRQRFPEHFAKDVSPTRRPPVVNSPTTRSGRPSSKEKGFQELPREAQDAARDFLRRKRIKSLDDYAKTYWEEDEG